MKYLLVTLGLSFGLLACQSDSSTPEPSATEISIEEDKPKENLFSAPASYMQLLQAKANGIEATMYTSGASFSVFEKGSVLAFTQLIALEAPKSTSSNQIGHIMFLADGEQLLLSHVFNNGSEVYMRIEDEANEATYYNVLKGQAREMFLKAIPSQP